MHESSLNQVHLVIRRQGNNFYGSWIDEGKESAPFSLALPLNEDDAKDLRWYLETFIDFPGYGDRARARGIEARLTEWGNRAFRSLFTSSSGAEALQRLLTADAARARSLFTLRTAEPAVLAQPWELVRDQYGPLAFQGVTIRRQLPDVREVKHVPMTLPLRVLLIVSRPTDTGFIDPRTSVRPVLESLERMPEGTVEVDFCDPPTPVRLEEMLSQARDRGPPYHVVHFDGHGMHFPRTGGWLAFENDEAKNKPVKASKFGKVVADMGVPLVILEACRGAHVSDQEVTGSVAQALLQNGVGSVIAFSCNVHIKTASLFVERFYHKLVAGLTVGQAFADATQRLHEDPARWLHLGPDAKTIDLQDWFLPHLYQVGDDLALFGMALEKAGREAREREELVLSGFPPEPMYRFHGRALELLQIERAFRKHSAVVVSGMGGMGKTALAREAAHWWVRAGKFEMAVFCSFEQKQGAERVVQLLGQALEGDNFSARPAEEQWQTAVRLFRERPVLLVWDNFESTLPVFQKGEKQEADLEAMPLKFGEEARALVRRLYEDLTAGEGYGG